MKTYTLKVNDGMVKVMLKTGKDFSIAKVAAAEADNIVRKGRIIESDRPGYIHVDGNGKWYIEGNAVVHKRKKRPKE